MTPCSDEICKHTEIVRLAVLSGAESDRTSGDALRDEARVAFDEVEECDEFAHSCPFGVQRCLRSLWKLVSSRHNDSTLHN